MPRILINIRKLLKYNLGELDNFMALSDLSNDQSGLEIGPRSLRIRWRNSTVADLSVMTIEDDLELMHEKKV